MVRQSGVLLPLFSLPGAFGIGTPGQGARAFIDRIAAAGFSLWQLLPLCPPDSFRSPYAGRSSFSLDFAYADPDEMVAAGLLRREEAASCAVPNTGCVDSAAIGARLPILMAAAERADRTAVEEFLHQNEDTAVFCRLAAEREGGDPYVYAFLQYELDREWRALRAYAAERGVSLIGDLPIYVAKESYDALAEPRSFRSTGAVAGAPPDAFSPDGQVWGNPLYDYAAMREEGFSLLRRRFAFLRDRFDGIRLDHFRGYSAYYAIPEGEGAAAGRWEEGPRQDFFDAIADLTEEYLVIAEDLGVIDDETEALRRDNGFLSTRVLQFAFLGDPESPHLPANCPEDSAVYSGTHDNEPLAAFLASRGREELSHILATLGGDETASPQETVLSALLGSAARLAILPLCDLLGMGGEARINTPGRAEGNWQWRVTEEALAALDGEHLLAMNRLASRCVK